MKEETRMMKHSSDSGAAVSSPLYLQTAAWLFQRQSSWSDDRVAKGWLTGCRWSGRLFILYRRKKINPAAGTSPERKKWLNRWCKRILPPVLFVMAKGQGEKQDIPALAGQQADYFARTLLDYKTASAQWYLQPYAPYCTTLSEEKSRAGSVLSAT